jgi:hypothetical protein
MVFLSAKVHHRRTKKAPLDAGFDLQGGISGHQLLEARDVAPMVVRAAQRCGKGTVNGFILHEVLQLAERSDPMFGVGQALGLVQLRTGGQVPRLQTDLSPSAQEQPAKACDVYRWLSLSRLTVPRGGGGRPGSPAGGSVH